MGAKDSFACRPKSPTRVWRCVYHSLDLILSPFFLILLLAVIELLSQKVAIKLHKCEVNVPKEADVLVL